MNARNDFLQSFVDHSMSLDCRDACERFGRQSDGVERSTTTLRWRKKKDADKKREERERRRGSASISSEFGFHFKESQSIEILTTLSLSS